MEMEKKIEMSREMEKKIEMSREMEKKAMRPEFIPRIIQN
jgi:hypothetical protein